ncbi:hypothetical protein QZH41_002571 [Actinostola sp. cb2023]|nr:hypothetical protein QZH41_002571 [Actinostola sp. cb2023]
MLKGAFAPNGGCVPDKFFEPQDSGRGYGYVDAWLISNGNEKGYTFSNMCPSVDPTESSSRFEFSSCAHMADDQKLKASEMLKIWDKRVFSQGDFDLGCTSAVKHEIPLSDAIPFKQRHRRVPPAQYEEVRKHLREMLDSGVIRESHSPWSSPVVLVRKRDGSLRFCIDFRKLNARTVKDSYALPRIDEALEAMSGSAWFTTLDLKSGYWQIEVNESDKPKTAFTVGALGFYECNRMAFGLTNAPATFQRLMEHCMAIFSKLHIFTNFNELFPAMIIIFCPMSFEITLQ